MQISAVIFDYGCVLSLAPQEKDFEPLWNALGIDAKAFQSFYWRNREAYDLDVLDGTAFWQEIVREAGSPNSPDLIQKLADLDCHLWSHPHPIMVEWVRSLKQRGLKTAVLSNMPRMVGDCLRHKVRWLELFDYLCFSGELKIGKPNPAIYRTCLDALRVTAGQALFIDDREINVQAALRVGMPALLFESVEQLRHDLKPFGLAPTLANALTPAGSQSQNSVGNPSC